MKKRIILTLALISALTLPLYAMNHSGGNSGGHDMQMGSQQNMDMDHGSMASGGSDIMMIGTQSVDGMEAMGHLSPVKDGKSQFMLFVKDVKSGSSVAQGTVALKIKGPDGKTGDTIRLMPMNGYFVADIHMMHKGEYSFMVGSKLADEVKRAYEFSYDYE